MKSIVKLLFVILAICVFLNGCASEDPPFAEMPSDVKKDGRNLLLSAFDYHGEKVVINYFNGEIKENADLLESILINFMDKNLQKLADITGQDLESISKNELSIENISHDGRLAWIGGFYPDIFIVDVETCEIVFHGYRNNGSITRDFSKRVFISHGDNNDPASFFVELDDIKENKTVSIAGSDRLPIFGAFSLSPNGKYLLYNDSGYQYIEVEPDEEIFDFKITEKDDLIIYDLDNKVELKRIKLSENPLENKFFGMQWVSDDQILFCHAYPNYNAYTYTLSTDEMKSLGDYMFFPILSEDYQSLAFYRPNTQKFLSYVKNENSGQCYIYRNGKYESVDQETAEQQYIKMVGDYGVFCMDMGTGEILKITNESLYPICFFEARRR